MSTDSSVKVILEFNHEAVVQMREFQAERVREEKCLPLVITRDGFSFYRYPSSGYLILFFLSWGVWASVGLGGVILTENI